MNYDLHNKITHLDSYCYNTVILTIICFILASAEDPQCTTPKSRKNDPYGQSHLAPPSTSPGGVGTGAHPGHPGEDYEMNSPPNWARPPASPVSCVNANTFSNLLIMYISFFL